MALTERQVEGVCKMFANAFVYAEHSRGQGIGKALFGHLKSTFKAKGSI